MCGTVGRVVTGVLTGGTSELLRAGAESLVPKIPTPPPVPKAPDKARERDPQLNKALSASRRRGGLGGRGSTKRTLLTGSTGISDDDLNLGGRSLLGGS